MAMRARAVGRVAGGVARRTALGDLVGAGVERDRGAGRLGAREVIGRSLVPPRRRCVKSSRRRRAAVVVDDVLDDDQLSAAMSLLVTVQVLVWPMAIVPVQSAE